jgi:hypothetical protein
MNAHFPICRNKRRTRKRFLVGIVLAALTSTYSDGASSSNITAVWANEGGDKVTQDELRATNHTENLTGHVTNLAWNGSQITLSGARNEVVSFNLVLEAGGPAAANVSVSFNSLQGARAGMSISSIPTTGNGVFNWVNRPIELFYLRYLQIQGLSYFGYNTWDERQIPLRLQRPWTGKGAGTGTWTDCPDHDKFYPDIMVPLELVPTFNIAEGPIKAFGPTFTFLRRHRREFIRGPSRYKRMVLRRGPFR